MQTNLAPEFQNTLDGQAAEAILRKCVHCGFCTATCPTYQLLGDELDGPRGRIYLMKQVLEGVHATLRQLSAALERNKVSEVAPPAGTKFDPHQHQAISVVPVDQEANTVVAVLQKGYLIADRVLRPALVTVAGPKP